MRPDAADAAAWLPGSLLQWAYSVPAAMGLLGRPMSWAVAPVRRPGKNTIARRQAMRYMMFVCTDTEPDTDKSPEPDIDAWVADNDTGGRRLDGNVLAPPSAATTIRVRDGELLVSDGPFAETKEVIVGYDLLECADLDEAIEVARAHPMARGGRLELRPFADLDDQPG
jgi:hypothetical protein